MYVRQESVILEEQGRESYVRQESIILEEQLCPAGEQTELKNSLS